MRSLATSRLKIAVVAAELEELDDVYLCDSRNREFYDVVDTLHGA